MTVKFLIRVDRRTNQGNTQTVPAGPFSPGED